MKEKKMAEKEKLDKILEKLEEHDRRLATKDDLSVLKRDILDSQDIIIKELERAREDRVLALGKDREQDRRLEGLEKRVAKIEVKVG
jgi:hypothetical protein